MNFEELNRIDCLKAAERYICTNRGLQKDKLSKPGITAEEFLCGNADGLKGFIDLFLANNPDCQLSGYQAIHFFRNLISPEKCIHQTAVVKLLLKHRPSDIAKWGIFSRLQSGKLGAFTEAFFDAVRLLSLFLPGLKPNDFFLSEEGLASYSKWLKLPNAC